METAHTTRASLPAAFQETPFEELDHGHTAIRRRIVDATQTDPSWFSYDNFTKEEQYEKLAKSIVPLLGQSDQFLA